MEPIIYLVGSIYGVTIVSAIFWGGYEIGSMKTNLKNIQEDVTEIKADIKLIKNGK